MAGSGDEQKIFDELDRVPTIRLDLDAGSPAAYVGAHQHSSGAEVARELLVGGHVITVRNTVAIPPSSSRPRTSGAVNRGESTSTLVIGHRNPARIG